MTSTDRFVKRGFDIVVSASALALLWPVILVTWILATYDTGAPGLFHQRRVGKDGKLFTVRKVRTMRVNRGSTVTVRNDARITPLGAKLRRLKVDELPQFWNVLMGEMSLVGPRPDVPGYMDQLVGEDREILSLRPGITGPATLKYRDEEALLGKAEDPVVFNAQIIWPDKVRINREYIKNYSFRKDIHYLLATVYLTQHKVS